MLEDAAQPFAAFGIEAAQVPERVQRRGDACRGLVGACREAPVDGRA